MNMIQTEKLIFEYEKRDEEGSVIGTSRAIDQVDIDGNLLPSWDIMDLENLRLPSI